VGGIGGASRSVRAELGNGRRGSRREHCDAQAIDARWTPLLGLRCEGPDGAICLLLR